MTSAALCLLVALLSSSPAAPASGASDLSGTWTFTVHLPNGEQEHPTFVFKQIDDKLSGTYTGQLGEYNVSGTVKGQQVSFTVPAKNNRGEPLPLEYVGQIETASKMKGTLDLAGKFTVEWSAVRK